MLFWHQLSSNWPITLGGIDFRRFSKIWEIGHFAQEMVKLSISPNIYTISAHDVVVNLDSKSVQRSMKSWTTRIRYGFLDSSKILV